MRTFDLPLCWPPPSGAQLCSRGDPHSWMKAENTSQPSQMAAWAGLGNGSVR